MLDFNEFNISFIRHGQSEVNVLPDQLGQDPETKLTNTGRRQAQLLRTRFSKQFEQFDYVFSSDYTRALDTAKIVMDRDSARIIVVPELREYSAGEWTGKSRRTSHTPDVLFKMGTLNSAFLPPGGESMHQVERRASTWLENSIIYNSDMIAEAKLRSSRKPIMNIAVFSHGMTIKCLLHYIMGFDQSFLWKLTLENTSITKLVFREDGWRLITINDHAHLL
jgi:broad specificity phosphatase PhoE